MRPQGTRVLRRERRRAWKGTPGGRRATHPVRTTYGQRQRERDRLIAWGHIARCAPRPGSGYPCPECGDATRYRPYSGGEGWACGRCGATGWYPDADAIAAAHYGLGVAA